MNNEFKCLLCGATGDSCKVVSKVDEKFKLVKCSNYGFIFAEPRPTFDELFEYYSTYYIHKYESVPLTEKKAISLVKGLNELIKSYNPNAKFVLDIGCGSGSTLYGLKLMGYEVVGTDLSKSACELITEHYRLKVYNSEFPPKELKINSML